MSTLIKKGHAGSAGSQPENQQDIFALVIHPALPLDTLYNPVMVILHAGSPSREYKAPRGLICGQSAYFDRAFSERFEEGQKQSINLPDVPHWLLEVYLGWLYSQRLVISLDRKAEIEDCGDVRQAASSSSTEVESFPADIIRFKHNDSPADHIGHFSAIDNDASTWPWQRLVELYIFGDKYDTRRFRTAVMEAIQIKAFQYKPHKYTAPGIRVLRLAFTSLPPESQLYKFFFELLTYDFRPMQAAAEYATLPPEVLAASWLRLQQMRDLVKCDFRETHEKTCVDRDCDGCKPKGTCDDPCHGNIENGPVYDDDMHRYHEHDTEEEARLCNRRWDFIVDERLPIREEDTRESTHVEAGS